MELPLFMFHALSQGIKASIKYFADSNHIHEDDRTGITDKISTHIRFVDKWSGELQFYGMTKPVDVDAATIDLTIDEQPRRFRSSDGSSRQLRESDLVKDHANYMILGDPGSGKTTTVKRLARYVLTQPPNNETSEIGYPIVIRASDLVTSTIARVLADVVGIQDKEETTEAAALHGDAKTFRVDKAPLSKIVFDFLYATKAIIFIDGIDEVPKNRATFIEKELADLAQASWCKIVVTCRSGDFGRQIEGFNLVEIAPLSSEEAAQIVSRWADHPGNFIEQIINCPYRDVINRPLFLTQLIIIFNNTGSLPAKPSDVYRRILVLMLEKWDQHRGIRRESRYSSFDPDQKLEFLSSLSFSLTYRIKKKLFSSAELSQAYRQINDRFSLPSNEAEMVAAEIESHNGIIVKSSYSEFEFSHLSLQEYLAADYLVSEPLISRIAMYLDEYPAPVAIAVALASNPAVWFATLILRVGKLRGGRPCSLATLRSLVKRVILERPYFGVSGALGLAVLKIFSDFNQEANEAKSPHYAGAGNAVPADAKSGQMDEVILDKSSVYNGAADFFEELILYPNVKHSVVSALRYYAIDLRQTDAGEASWIAKFILENDYLVFPDVESEIPRSLYIPRALLQLLSDMPVHLPTIDRSGTSKLTGLLQFLSRR